jgi:cob(I)alamin adenosyltransferase
MKNRITKVTTKRGDRGKTSIADGTELDKQHPRIEAIGTLDELNSHLGLLVVELGEDSPPGAFCLELQQDLFNLGACLAVPGLDQFPDVARVEAEVERLNAALPPLKEFVLPGGTRAAALAHVNRTVCRRAERRWWALHEAPPAGAAYLNRLSDYFFVLARTLNAGGPEAQWRGMRRED